MNVLHLAGHIHAQQFFHKFLQALESLLQYLMIYKALLPFYFFKYTNQLLSFLLLTFSHRFSNILLGMLNTDLPSAE